MKEIIILVLTIFMGSKGFGQKSTNLRIDSLLSETISTYNIPSMTVAVVYSDTIFYGVKGNTRIDTIQKVNLTDKYHIGSNTKAFTSFLTFQAIEENKISLETKFIDLYPDLGEIRKEYKTITLSDLLSHNARIRAYTSGAEFKKIPEFEGSIRDKRYQFANYVLNEKPVKSGEYSNAGYVLAAMMIEKVYNSSYEDILKNTMNEMGFEVFYGFPNKQNINYPWGHWKEKKNQIALSPKHEYRLEDYMLPAGDLSINILDYSKFIQLHLNGVLGKDSLLKQTSFEKLFYDKAPYSYGWGNQISEKGKLVFHDGSAGTFYSHTLISSTYEFAIIIIMNCAEDDQIEGLYELRTKLFGLRKELR